MEIVSWNFLFFTSAVILVYYALNRYAQNIWLVIASAGFIGTHGWQNLLPLAVISGILLSHRFYVKLMRSIR